MTVTRVITAVVAMLAAGCAAPPSPNAVPQAPANHVALDASKLVELADRAFSEAEAADYRRPIVGNRFTWEPVRTAYREACHAGDHRACRMVVALRDPGGTRDGSVDNELARDCRQGDSSSCRAMTVITETRDAMPGEWARWRACREHRPECSSRALHDECATERSPESCRLSRDIEHETDKLAVRFEMYQRIAGCFEGLVDDCVAAVREVTFEDAAAEACRLSFQHCEDVRTSTSLARRDLLERWCQVQRDGPESCRTLVAGYVAREFPEPIAGRAAALHDWLCRRGHQPCVPLARFEETIVSTAPRADARHLVEVADRALAESEALDYRRPLVVPEFTVEPIRALYLDACRAGDHRACRVEVTLETASSRQASHAVTDVTRHCRQGDRVSCRILPGDQTTRDDLPGSWGRWVGCAKRDGGCDVTALRRECEEGFPESCGKMRLFVKADEDSALWERQVRLHIAGCLSGVVSECADAGRESRVTAIYRESCRLQSRGCDEVGLSRGRERDVAERACQIGSIWNTKPCKTLVEAYERHDYPEPVPGRAKALREWMCKKAAVGCPDTPAP